MSEYGLAAAVIALCTGLCLPLFPFLALTDLVMVYLVGALLVAMRGKRGPAAFAALLSVLCFDFFFVPPRFTLAVAHHQYLVTFVVMFSVAVFIGHLTLRIKAQAEAARLGEMRTATMHALSQELAQTRGADAILNVAVVHLARVFDSEVTPLPPESLAGPADIELGRETETDTVQQSISAKLLADPNRLPPVSVQASSGASFVDVPLVGSGGLAGVLRMRPRQVDRPWNPDQLQLLESLARQVAMALEVDRLQDAARRSQISADTERLRSSLLSAVSHDLRTPLAAILGSATSLLQSQGGGSGKSHELLGNIRDEAERLSRLVHNLIETTRLESGAVKIRKEPYPIEELVGAALGRLDKALKGRKVKTRLAESLPLVPVDAVLMELLLVNLIDNALRHTPPEALIEISAEPGKDALEVVVADRGPGLAPEDLEQVFQKFYRAKGAAGGSGLGLAICKAVVEAHGGRIWAENRRGGGAAFRLTIPGSAAR